MLSVKGISFRTEDEPETMVCHGPMCKHAEDLAPSLRVLAGDKAAQLNLDYKVCISTLILID